MNIKKILVPTDFSNAANNALIYASSIAELYGAEIDIVHAFTIPVMTARGKPVLQDQSILMANQQAAEELLEKTKLLVSGKNRVRYNTKAIPIYWQMDLAAHLHSQHTDLIIMGTTGASGWKEIFLGSNTARVIQDSSVPVLAVPEKAKLSQQLRIGLAYDGLEFKEIEKLSIVNSFRNVLHASIHIFQIMDTKDSPSSYLTELIRFLPGAEYNDVYGRVVESGILKCIELNHFEMLVMIPRKHGFFHNLISGSITKRVAYEISVPLLAIPE